MSKDPLQILIVEDEPQVAHTIYAALQHHGYSAKRCGTGQEAITYAETEHVDLVILDLGLPDMDGLEVLHHLRERSQRLPVLILTARDAVQDRIQGLDGGADDYLAKPFSLPELVARLRALERRIEMGRAPALQCADLELDVDARSVSRSGQPLDLSPREFDLLRYLLAYQGQVVTRSMLAKDVWNYHSRVTPIDNIIDVQMSRLREKVDKPFGVQLIKTVRGVGFTLREPE